MTPMQFIACADETCPMNSQKQCRAPFIALNDKGECLIREGGPYHSKSEVERYVEIMECQCQKCHNWEVDESRNIGTCGFKADLFFATFKLSDGAVGPPTCNEFAKQISEPGFPKNS